MARFASQAELETFLGKLDPDYGQYAAAVWQNGVRTAHHLANAEKEDLVAAGAASAIHAKDIKARASRLASGNSQLCLWLDIPPPLLHIPNLA